MRLIGPDTNRTPDQFVSSGSRTIAAHSRPIRMAAAEARAALVELASKRLNVPADQLTTADGIVSVRSTPARKVTYADLVGGKQFNVKITGKAKPKQPKDYRIVGTSVPRWDIPEKVFGSFTYMQDVKVAGMLHGRVVRPPAHGASVIAIDESSVARIPGLVKVVRVADLVGVVCRREEQAIAAAQALKVTWSSWAALPDMKDLHSTLRNLPEFPQGYPKESPGGVLAKSGDVEAGLGKAVKLVKATYLSPFNHHGSIGPSCAVADVRADGVTLWCGTQTPYGAREAAAKFLGLPNEKVRLIYAEASGCYGQKRRRRDHHFGAVARRASRWRAMVARREQLGGLQGRAHQRMPGRAGRDGKSSRGDARTLVCQAFAPREPKHGGEPGSLVTHQLAGWTSPVEKAFPRRAISSPSMRTCPPSAGFLSGPTASSTLRVGHARRVRPTIFVAECCMDELAAAAWIHRVH